MFHVEHFEDDFHTRTCSMWNTLQNSYRHFVERLVAYSSNSVRLQRNVFLGSLH